eukprot:467414-Hanusia_phi.AAC.2
MGKVKIMMSGGIVTNEELFVTQLHTRALLLDHEFQHKVLSVIQMHRASSGSTQDLMSRLVSCKFNGRVFDIEVIPAPLKTKERMLQKLCKYANPAQQVRWPFSGRILDCVRASVVCHNSSQILEIYKWFEDDKSTKLPICRVKNKFAMQTVPDGYRDLTLCVIFTGESGLKIIGEIQIHDKQIHDIKVQFVLVLVLTSVYFSSSLSHHHIILAFSFSFSVSVILITLLMIVEQMHKLYKVKRAEKPNNV